jgi:hypothetical protein
MTEMSDPNYPIELLCGKEESLKSLVIEEKSDACQPGPAVDTDYFYFQGILLSEAKEGVVPHLAGWVATLAIKSSSRSIRIHLSAIFLYPLL